MFKIRLVMIILCLLMAFKANAAFRGYQATAVLRPDVLELDSGEKVKLAGVTFDQDKASEALEGVKNIVSAGYLVPVFNGQTFDYDGEKINQADIYIFGNSAFDPSLMKDIPVRGFQKIKAGGELKANVSAFSVNSYLVSQGVLIKEASDEQNKKY
jgi:hypothetical protein